MPRGDKSSYSGKQRRMAEHIEESAEKRGRSRKTAERIAWATVNKRTGGAKGKKSSSSSSSKSTKKSSSGSRGSSRGKSTSSSRSAAAKKGWRTRRRNATKSK